VQRAAIDARLDGVGALAADALARGALRTALDGVRDVERLASKTAANRATPREVRALGDSLARLPAVAAALGPLGGASAPGVLAEIVGGWDDATDLSSAITRTLTERPPVTIGDGDTIAAGVDDALDDLRRLRDGSKNAIAALQSEERTRTGIGSLKVGYNRVFGYYLEVTRANTHLVPESYQRRQTLTGAERYVTPALKEFEERILTATERCEQIERERFEALRARVASEITRLQAVASRLATLDVLASLAEVAEQERYVRPDVTDDFLLRIEGGRHPVVERMMPRDQFIPNDVTLSRDARLIVLTGPNMAGKSTILRQIGLIVLLAQIGSFVPASKAVIGVCDRVFTRVGASDNLVRNVIGSKTVFATHYHELTQLADELAAVRNYNVAVREVGETVLFLHRLQPGGADRSYGIEVGRLAGLPPEVIARARVLLRLLEGGDIANALARGSGSQGAPADQLTLFSEAQHPAVLRLREIDPNAITPIAALQVLAELSALARETSPAEVPQA
jgi:DNA mismatch repair protein MutS